MNFVALREPNRRIMVGNQVDVAGAAAMSEETLVHEALAKPSAERAAFLDAACAGQSELRAAVEALLAVHEASGDFFDTPRDDPAQTLPSGPVQARPDTTAARTPEPLEASHVATRTANYLPMTESGALIAGRYTLQQKIGEGGMGEVWVARQTEPVKRKVALKLIKTGMDSRAVVLRFEQERQALAMMDHPNIAKVLDGGLTPNGQPFFVMELVNGLPLTKFCDEVRLSTKERLELFVPICQAVQHAHHKGIVHRDLKPANILVTMIDGNPIPKVIDFGVAKATSGKLTDESMSTQFGAVVGTLEYMSPEQAGFSSEDIDTRADIYSLGVILYELLTGLRPIDVQRLRRAALTEMIRIIREEEPSKPSTRLAMDESLPSMAALRQTEPRRLMAMLRGELDWVVMKCLEKRRERRYETANGLARDIQRYLADEPVEARPPSAEYRMKKFLQRHKGPVFAASVILLCLVAGIISTSAGLVWAVRERNAKAEALTAETEERTEKEKALAAEKQSRQKAVEALRAMTDEVIETQMARGTTLTEENKEFLRKIIKHFQGFAAITADDADSKAIRAEGYYRVGLMQARLGALKEAEAAYTDSLGVWKQLAADFPASSEFRTYLALSHNNLGRVLLDTGRLKEAEDAYGEALVLQKELAADFPSRPEFRLYVATVHSNLGRVLRDTGRLREAEAAIADSLAIKKQLVADFPTRLEFRRELSGGYHHLGDLLYERGRLKEAAAAYTESIALQKQVVVEFPNRPKYREGLGETLNNLGILLRVMRRPKEAQDTYSEALAMFKQLAADFQTVPEYREIVARIHNNRGNLLRDTGRPMESEADFISALNLLKQLATDFPTRPEFRRELAMSCTNMGILLKNTGRLKQADAHYADALALEQQLAADFPKRPDLRSDLAGTCISLALLRLGQRDFHGAIEYLEKAAPHREAALEANPRNPAYLEVYGDNLTALIQASAGLGDKSAAIQAAEKRLNLGLDPPRDAYNAACGLSLCIPIVETNEPATKEERDKQAQFFGDEAMKMLSEAVAKGWNDTSHMKQDTDLDPLREREDFKELLAELEKPSPIKLEKKP
jgi:eukaryotic-like serine/threonine-protein kinase